MIWGRLDLVWSCWGFFSVWFLQWSFHVYSQKKPHSSRWLPVVRFRILRQGANSALAYPEQCYWKLCVWLLPDVTEGIHNPYTHLEKTILVNYRWEQSFRGGIFYSVGFSAHTNTECSSDLRTAFSFLNCSPMWIWKSCMDRLQI